MVFSKLCGYNCGRPWDEEGGENGFEDCVSAFHKKKSQTPNYNDILEPAIKEIFPLGKDEVIMVKTYTKKEYLHHDFDRWDRLINDWMPIVAVNAVEEGAVDSRDVEMIEKMYRQSDLFRLFFQQALTQATERAVREEKIRKIGIIMSMKLFDFTDKETGEKIATNTILRDDLLSQLTKE